MPGEPGGFGPAAFDHMLALMSASAAVQRWGAQAFDGYVGQSSYTSIADVDAIVEGAGIGDQQRVLELGCGTGGIACYIAAKTGCRIDGLDWSETAVRLSRERAKRLGLRERVRITRADIGQASLPPAAYDVVFSIDAVYFGVEFDALIARIAAALRPGGALVMLLTLADPTAAGVTAAPGIPAEADMAVAIARAGLATVLRRDLMPAYTALVERVGVCWQRHLPALRQELGDALTFMRLEEDARLLSLLRSGDVRRVLWIARR